MESRRDEERRIKGRYYRRELYPGDYSDRAAIFALLVVPLLCVLAIIVLANTN